MKSVLIVGNLTKDIYLRLDPRSTPLEIDQQHTGWLDLAFNGSSHDYFSRVAIFGGASISLEVCRRFGLDATIMGSASSFENGQLQVAPNTNLAHRYILCHNQDVSYFSPSKFPENTWQTPAKAPDWIYLDRSAIISAAFAEQLLSYLDQHSSCQLAIFLGKRSNAAAAHLQALIEHAQLVISDTTAKTGQFNITPTDISTDSQTVSWNLRGKDQYITHLSAHLIIGASIVAGLALDKSPHWAMNLAKYNVERATLSGTANLNTLEESMIEDGIKTDSTSTEREIFRTAKQLMAPQKGILAADESGGSIHKKFEAAGIPDDAEHRRDYRNIFLDTPELEKYVSGVILFDETARQHADDGSTFVELLQKKHIIPGIKVDQGLENFPDSPEKYTKGLDGLPKRLAEYYQMGMRFAKWRSAFELNPNQKPSDQAIQKNTADLAEYARLCQAAEIVPIVEPELVFDGDHSLEECAEYTGKILDALFAALAQKGVLLAGCLLKVSMVLAGKQFAEPSTVDQVGQATAELLRTHVPAELAGVVFLSGGQGVEQATANLAAIKQHGPFPWPISFSYARALQEPALEAWQGNNAKLAAARAAFTARLVANCAVL